ncbi:hypothetical protein, partial [Escherichia coli]|uniref:hypothetical protein n=1 Tax=Escherichia coli TaxID=562 RepID=UPI00200BBC25
YAFALFSALPLFLHFSCFLWRSFLNQSLFSSHLSRRRPQILENLSVGFCFPERFDPSVLLSFSLETVFFRFQTHFHVENAHS